MLDKTGYTVPPLASIGTKTMVSHRGQTIAKTRSWGPRDRAVFAAKWRLGLIQVEPTVKLAALTYGVSVPLVREEIKILKTRTARANNRVKANGDEALDAYVRDNLLKIWDAVERVTR
jgi:hypothetical protein